MLINSVEVFKEVGIFRLNLGMNIFLICGVFFYGTEILVCSAVKSADCSYSLTCFFCCNVFLTILHIVSYGQSSL